MNPTRPLSSPHAPAVLSKWLLLAFVAVLLVSLVLPAWKAGGPEPMLSIVALLPWMAGPAGLATLLVARARSSSEGWLFVGAEAVAIASIVWLLIVLAWSFGYIRA